MKPGDQLFMMDTRLFNMPAQWRLGIRTNRRQDRRNIFELLPVNFVLDSAELNTARQAGQPRGSGQISTRSARARARTFQSTFQSAATFECTVLRIFRGMFDEGPSCCEQECPRFASLPLDLTFWGQNPMATTLRLPIR